MALLKEEILELSVLAQKWEKEYVDILTQMAVDFQEKSADFREKLDEILVDYEEAKLKDLKDLERKMKQAKKSISACVSKLNRKKGLKKNRETLVKILRELK